VLNLESVEVLGQGYYHVVVLCEGGIFDLLLTVEVSYSEL